MPAAKTPAEADKLPGSPHDSAPKAARERRESERLITDWEQETTQLGRALALMTLDVSAMPSEKWAHRFIISLRPVVEDCVLLFYGAKFAALMELPEKPDHSVPMVEQLPARYVPVFTSAVKAMNATRYSSCRPSSRSAAPCSRTGALRNAASIHPFAAPTLISTSRARSSGQPAISIIVRRAS
jgi:hypothetical protein